MSTGFILGLFQGEYLIHSSVVPETALILPNRFLYMVEVLPFYNLLEFCRLYSAAGSKALFCPFYWHFFFFPDGYNEVINIAKQFFLSNFIICAVPIWRLIFHCLYDINKISSRRRLDILLVGFITHLIKKLRLHTNNSEQKKNKRRIHLILLPFINRPLASKRPKKSDTSPYVFYNSERFQRRHAQQTGSQRFSTNPQYGLNRNPEHNLVTSALHLS